MVNQPVLTSATNALLGIQHLLRLFIAAVTATALVTASSVFAKPSWTSNPKEIDCIAAAVYHEARGEPVMGQIAVAEVVIARTQSGKYPASPCKVVTQSKQFSFVDNGKISRVDPNAMRSIRVLVQNVITGKKRTNVRGALFFHTVKLPRQWRRPKAGQIGGHVFYR